MDERRPYAEVEAERARYPFGKPTPYTPGHKNHLLNDDAPDTGTPQRATVAERILKLVCLMAFLVIAACLMIEDGFNKKTFAVVIGAGLVIAIPWYFSTRNHERPPSAFETAAATCWLWFRRISCCGTGCLIVLAALFSGSKAVHPFLSVVALLLGAFIIYIGWFGQGNSRSSLKDDIELHKKNKRRYKWRF